MLLANVFRGPTKFCQLSCFFLIFIYLFMAVLGLRFCARAFSSCGKRGHSSSRCTGLSLSWPLLLWSTGCRRAGSVIVARAQPLRGMWDLPRPGLEPVSPALAGRFSTTAPPGKPCSVILMLFQNENKI